MEDWGEEDVPLSFSSRILGTFHPPKILFPFPLRRLDYLTNSEKKKKEKWNVFTRNIEIVVKPSH